MARKKKVNFELHGRDKTAQAFASVQRRMGTLTRAMGGLKTAIGGAFAVAGVSAWINKSLKAADVVAKLASETGIAADTLQAYQHAASLAGIGQNEFNTSVERFTKRLGEAKSGVGPLATTLAKLDGQLAANIVTASSTDEAMRMVFEAMAAIEDPAKRAALAAAAFGREGVSMVNLVRGGMGDLDAATQQFEKLGKVMGGDGLAAAEQANDAMLRLQTTFDLLGVVLAIKVAPAIAGIADWMAMKIPAAVEQFQVAFEAVGSIANEIANIFAEVLPAPLNDFVMSFVESFGENGLLIGALTVAGVAIRAFLAAAGPVGLLLAGASAVVYAFENWDKIVEFARGVYEGVKTWMLDKFSGVVDSVHRKVEAIGGFFSDLKDAVVGNSYVPDMVDGIIQHFGRLQEGMVGPANRYTAQVANDFELMGGTVNDVMNETWSQATRTIQQFVETGKLDFDNLKTNALGALQDIINNALRSQDILSGIGGSLSSVFSGISSFFGFGGGPSITTPVATFADGGQHAGGLRIVGEQGPELEATGASRIYTTQQTRDMMSGGDSAIFIDARGAVVEQVNGIMQAIRRLDGSIEQRATSAIVNATRRNPLLRS